MRRCAKDAVTALHRADPEPLCSKATPTRPFSLNWRRVDKRHRQRHDSMIQHKPQAFRYLPSGLRLFATPSWALATASPNAESNLDFAILSFFEHRPGPRDSAAGMRHCRFRHEAWKHPARAYSPPAGAWKPYPEGANASPGRSSRRADFTVDKCSDIDKLH